MEIGAGFHGELTGRQNILLHGVILGMSREEIKRSTSAIIEFSEIQGDLNYDGLINIQDVIMIVNFILNNHNNECSDINEDGLIDILDIINLLDIILDN